MKTNRKILVVDDDAVVGKSFERVLSVKGYAVVTAHDGPEALEKINNERYDAVFTDIKMPGMSGIEVAERIKATRPWLPVVIVTGYGTEDNEARAKAAGVAEFLRKPLSPEVIETSAEKAVAASETAATELEAAAAPAAAETAARASLARRVGTAAKNVALFFAAPFIGLAYIIALPFVGFGMLAWLGAKALMKHEGTRRLMVAAGKTSMLVVGPILGLVYIVALPAAGFAMLAWMGVKAMRRGAVQ